MKLTRKKIQDRIPFSFGIIQRIADDLQVTRSAVSLFINKPENEDILEALELEKSRIHDYAQLNIFDAIIANDLETTKWYMATFPRPGSAPQRKHSINYKNRLDKTSGYINGSWDYTEVRKLRHRKLDIEDGYLEGANLKPFTKEDTEYIKQHPPKPWNYITYGKERNTTLEEKRLKNSE